MMSLNRYCDKSLDERAVRNAPAAIQERRTVKGIKTLSEKGPMSLPVASNLG